MFVIIEYVKGNCKKLPSDSSDSSTHHSPFPSLAEFPIELITPPLIVVGSNFDFEKIVETIDVVVVLPCDPATTTFFYSNICKHFSSFIDWYFFSLL